MDRIGGFTFIRLDRPPPRTGAQWEISARSGINGIALYNTGIRGEPFTLAAEAVALNHLVGSTFLAQYKALELTGPVTVQNGLYVPDNLYKVLNVDWDGPGPKAMPRVHVANDPLWYTCVVFTRWTLVPIDPFTQPP